MRVVSVILCALIVCIGCGRACEDVESGEGGRLEELIFCVLLVKWRDSFSLQVREMSERTSAVLHPEWRLPGTVWFELALFPGLRPS